MELAIQASCLVKKPLSSSVHSSPLNTHSKTRLISPLNAHIKAKLTVKSTDSSSPSTSPPEEQPNNPSTKTSVGFGSSPPTETQDGKKRKKNKGRASVIRRTPLDKPAFLSKKVKTPSPEQSSTETAFLLTWLGLGSLILIEGLVLSASGLFPEEWDKLLVKYLYPAFTPTVFFFVAGTVVYGVIKYLEVEKPKSS